MNKDELIAKLAQVLAGLQVPVSLGLPLGVAKQPWNDITDLVGFGWHDADEYEAALRARLTD